jgi:cell division protein FtsB
VNRWTIWAGFSSLVVLALVFGLYGEEIKGAYEEASKVQLQLDAANAEIATLKQRVTELEKGRALDEQRLAELQAKVH